MGSIDPQARRFVATLAIALTPGTGGCSSEPAAPPTLEAEAAAELGRVVITTGFARPCIASGYGVYQIGDV